MTKLDLDAIETRAEEAFDQTHIECDLALANIVRQDVPALVARVRELEAALANISDQAEVMGDSCTSDCLHLSRCDEIAKLTKEALA